MAAAWGGALVYDRYGVGDIGAIAAEGPDKAGMYVQEDAQYLEILDSDSCLPVADGQTGDTVATCLYKDDVFPIIRFNIHDVSAFRTDTSALGFTFRRIQGFLSRSDNMLKLRGINICPTGIGAILTGAFDDLMSEYVCVVDRQDGRDKMLVRIEARGDTGRATEAYQALLRTRLGGDVVVQLAAPGGLSALTGIEARQKPFRLIDRPQ